VFLQAFKRLYHPQVYPLLIALLVESHMLMLVPTQLEYELNHLAEHPFHVQALLLFFFLHYSLTTCLAPLILTAPQN
jgi:hypothetical protein